MEQYEQWYMRIAALMNAIRLRTLDVVQDGVYSAANSDDIVVLKGTLQSMALVLQREQNAERLFLAYQTQGPFSPNEDNKPLATAQELLTQLQVIDATLLDPPEEDAQ